jgi:hypothetical protein
MDLLSECVEIADSVGCRLTIRQSNAHGLCFSIGLVDKNSERTVSADKYWGDTIELALAEFKRVKSQELRLDT